MYKESLVSAALAAGNSVLVIGGEQPSGAFPIDGLLPYQMTGVWLDVCDGKARLLHASHWDRVEVDFALLDKLIVVEGT